MAGLVCHIWTSEYDVMVQTHLISFLASEKNSEDNSAGLEKGKFITAIIVPVITSENVYTK